MSTKTIIGMLWIIAAACFCAAGFLVHVSLGLLAVGAACAMLLFTIHRASVKRGG